MIGKDIFKIWAPFETRWVEWVKPVQFITINNQLNSIYNFKVPKLIYLNNIKTDTAIIIDLPSYESVEEGIALAKLGFRPIPLFNGTDEQQGSMGLVDNHMIKQALIWGALELKNLKIDNNAPPVFLLDSNRTHRFKMNVSIFDNSWDIYDQDFPTANYFLDKGINKIIIRTEIISKDLIKILYKYQKEGIKILFTNGYEKPKKKIIKKQLK